MRPSSRSWLIPHLNIESNIMDGPDQIGPDHSPKQAFGDKLRRVVRKFTTRYELRLN